jgi:hypothetical protein
MADQTKSPAEIAASLSFPEAFALKTEHWSPCKTHYVCLGPDGLGLVRCMETKLTRWMERTGRGRAVAKELTPTPGSDSRATRRSVQVPGRGEADGDHR